MSVLSKKLSNAFNQAFALLPFILAFSLLVLPFLCIGIFAGRRYFASTIILDKQCFQYLIVAFAVALVIGLFGSIYYFKFREKPILYLQVGFAFSIAAIMMLVILLALSNMDFCSMDRSRAKRTMADTKTIAEVIENYRCAKGEYPKIHSMMEVVRLEPMLEKWKDGLKDGWGVPFEVSSSSKGYWIISKGGDAQFDVAHYDQYPINHVIWPESDFVFHNGMWIQNPFLDVYMKTDS